MIFKHLSRLSSYFSTQARQELSWKTNANGVEVYYTEAKFLQKLVFHGTVNIKISQFLMALSFKDKDVVYPEGVNPQSDLVNFLLER